MAAARGPGNSQEFEEMEVVKFRWWVRDLCCRLLLSLKEASNYQAVRGIVLASIILVFGAGGSFLLATLRSHNIQYHGLPEKPIAWVVGVWAIVDGILLLIYNIILLNKVGDNGAAGVFKTIKVGCLGCLLLQILKGLLIFSCFVYLLSGVTRTPIPFSTQVSGLIGAVLGLLLSTLVIYAVFKAKPNIVSIYIYTEGILLLISLVILGYSIAVGPFLDQVYPAGIILLVILILEKIYTVDLFILHVNMMTSALPSKNQLQLIDL